MVGAIKEATEPRVPSYKFEVIISRSVGSSCSNSGTCDAILVTNPVISHERGKDRIVTMTNGTHPWSFGIKLFHNV
jgi:hypothetical protein